MNLLEFEKHIKDAELKVVSTSTVLENMATRPHYTPYCGNMLPVGLKDGCHNPRTVFSLKHNQFLCPNCGWISQHSDTDIEQYKKFNQLINHEQ